MEYIELGNLIKTEREKRGWGQADLASALKRGQQAISRWENGKSRPKRDDLLKLADLFSGDVEEWHLIAGYQIERPDSALVPFLPLDSLTAENFELFCRDLIQNLNPGADVQRYGSQGDDQEGIDIYAKHTDGKVLDYQCKRHKQFGPTDVSNAISATDFVASRHHLLLSRRATSRAKKTILMNKNWSLWDLEGISSKIRYLDSDRAVRIVETYFPGWRKKFLGLEEPSPWLTPQEFYQLLANKTKLFSHGWSFVGRQKEIKLLEEFVEQKELQAIVVSGRGGIGKSRMLKFWADEISKVAVVRFVSSGTEVKPGNLELLPTGPSFLVIDDVHERPDLVTILNGIARLRPEMKLVLSTRPYGLARLNDDLTRVGVSFDRDRQINLTDLSVEDSRVLAEEILSDVGGDIKFAKRIAEITKDCPLATVIGSRLVGKGQIKPELLNNVEAFREELLLSFRNVIAGEIGGSDSENIRDLLDYLSLVQPFNPSDPTFIKSTEETLKTPFDKTMRDIGNLEDAGVLLRRGNKLRIVPDLLADYIRSKASYNEKNNMSTGFAERVFKVAENDLATNLLVNISQLDWRLSIDGIRSSLLNEVWSSLKEQFRAAKIFERSLILKAIEKVAYYQPGHALDFIHLALDEPTNEIEEEQPAFLFTEPSYDMVIKEVAPILRYVAYNQDHIIESLELLKDLAKRDHRPTNSHPDHPLRILQELASIEPGKPIAYIDAVANHVITWLASETTSDFSPFDVLDELLKTEGHQSESKGLTLTLKPFRVKPEAVAELRQRVLNVAFEALHNSSIEISSRAIKTIAAGLHYPFGFSIKNISQDELAVWDKEFLVTLSRLKDVVRDPKIDPFISIEVRSAVSWHSNYSNSGTKEVAQKILLSIPKTIPHEVTRALVDSWGWSFERKDGKVGRDEAELIRWRDDLAKEVTTQYKDNFDGLIKMLEERIDSMNIAKISRSPDAGPFLGSLMDSSIDFAEYLGNYLLSNSKSPLAIWFNVVIMVMNKSKPNIATSFIQRAVNENVDVLIRCVAGALGWGLRGVTITNEEIEIIKILAVSKDPWIRQSIVNAVKRFSPENKSIALEILLSIDLTDSQKVAEEVTGEFESEYSTFKIADLSEDQLQTLLNQLVKCPSIDGYEICLFLSHVSLSNPELTLKTLQGRVEYKESNPKLKEYEPLPHSMENNIQLRFQETANYEEVLRNVRDWSTVDTGNWIRPYFGLILFKLVSSSYDDVTLKVLGEWVDSTDEKQLEAVADLLTEANTSFIWENQQYIINILEQAQKHGIACYKRVCSSMHTLAVHGGRSGTVGEPFPEDIIQRDRSYELMTKLPPGSPAQRFFKLLYEEALSEIKRHTKEDFDFE
jgi:transcriptional regulator with XRE-family HTH domain